jgi:copper chaperone
METLKFRTTIKCSGCLGKATPFLNKTAGEDNWQVDTENPDKILTVVPGTVISENDIIKAVEEAGYKAERING